MKIILAGYNVDADVIDELAASREMGDVTPETISAAYARISRDPRPVDELRKLARKEVEKARRSNKNIIFGLGHHSVAEHAVFNFDIIGVSRLAIEEIEKFRLCSYTEKSQRYITLKDEFIVPPEIQGSNLESRFVKTVNAQNELYHKLFDRLKERVARWYHDEAESPGELGIIEGIAKEDARYITSLATAGQLGETINARNLELLLRRFASHELLEVREIGKRMYECVADVAPSIILFTEANDYDQKTYPALRTVSADLAKTGIQPERPVTVQLVDYTKDADLVLVVALLHTSTEMSYQKCREVGEKLSLEKKREIVKTACQRMELYDPVLREFEYIHLSFDIVVSASGFAQLKRHRMATITVQNYTPELGLTVPQSVIDCGMEKEFSSVAEMSERSYHALLEQSPSVAPYALTNAHRRRVLLGLNARELYHFSRLREDLTAQWEIRSVCKRMTELAREIMPLTVLLVGGKDSYPGIYEQVYGKPPKVLKPELPT
ncbi:FAD-dependent thymidylate synthase [candidate division TA06 bacterium]|uniref:FAD-dependent thymidylate synthase n=1 Tax=candidate division TA06 bacterium TaxID=2250710 RepID=A0A523UWQ5_UNCT6|nr:MAG: FAD-dependent thymidylate synthase [candidate division TA06 bacterium]